MAARQRSTSGASSGSSTAEGAQASLRSDSTSHWGTLVPLGVVLLGLVELTILVLIVINAGLLLLTSWLAQQLGIGWSVDGFWTAVIGSIIVSIVSFVLHAFLPNKDEPRRGRA